MKAKLLLLLGLCWLPSVVFSQTPTGQKVEFPNGKGTITLKGTFKDISKNGDRYVFKSPAKQQLKMQVTPSRAKNIYSSLEVFGFENGQEVMENEGMSDNQAVPLCKEGNFVVQVSGASGVAYTLKLTLEPCQVKDGCGCY